MKTTPARKKRVANAYGAPDKPLIAHAKLEVSSDLRELARVRDFVRHVCRELDGPALDETSTSEVQLAATEAASNIMRHACGGRADSKIDVQGQVRDDHISIELSHDGERFTMPQIESPKIDISTEGGLGLYLMHRILDDVIYREKQDQRQSTTLIKNRERPTMTES